MAITPLRLLVPMILGCLIMPSAFAESGRADYDLDDDGLIEINSLADLNEIRNNLDGTSLYGDSTGCPMDGCIGFELTTTLDFDTNADGVMDANDAYWNEGAGWMPISSSSTPFTTTFDGNGHQIRNLYINRSNTDYIGLFAAISGESAQLRNIGLTGELMQVLGDYYVGGLVGYAGSSATISQSYVSGIITGDRYVGGLAGTLDTNSTIRNSFATGTVSGNVRIGGLAGYLNGSSIVNSFAAGYVRGVGYYGGIGGAVFFGSFIENSYSIVAVNGTDIDSFSIKATTLVELQCPVGASNTSCIADKVLYAEWDNNVWDFGTSNQLPGLILEGITYRDSDGDGSLDSDDAFSNNFAASLDRDNDGHPDIWTIGCDANCISNSGLTLDQFPSNPAAWQDEDLDGYPDSWVDSCDANCQAISGLTLDSYPNDTDNDGINNIDDTDDNNDGIADADADSDGLIDVSSIEQLYAIRYNLVGTGRTSVEGEKTDSSGCPAVILNGVLQLHCSGYELTNNLDFDTNADGAMDENDAYWNDGEGWVPIGNSTSPFEAIFDGKGYQILNLYIKSGSDTGLFGAIEGVNANLRNIGLTGPLMNVEGYDNVGGLVGFALVGSSINECYSTGEITGRNNVGGLVGNLDYSAINNSFSTGSVTANGYVGSLLGSLHDSSVSNSFATGRVSAKSISGIGGLIGYFPFDNDILNSHWATDTTGQINSAGESEFDNYFGATLAELQCPTARDNTDDCVISNTLYAGWDSNVWDYGSNTELPGLIFDGVVYRDSDGDGSLDGDDAFPNSWAATIDADRDGYPDAWNINCDTECLETSGLTLDQFPTTSAAWEDKDIDGDPDSWAPDCDISCQNDSGLTLDIFPNDIDNDGINNTDDNDDNNDGIMDADADSDGLIDISSLEQFNAIRYNLAGTGRTLIEGEETDSSGCPAVILAGVLQHHCWGYELINTLDFDTNTDGVIDENDAYWNEGDGWEPIGTSSSLSFQAIFDGNGYQIRNLYINRSSTNYVGLFGYISGESAQLRNIGLTGEMMRVVGNDYVGGLVGYAKNAARIEQSYVTGVVIGDDYVGGLLGSLSIYGVISESFATGKVSGSTYVGGLVGHLSRSELTNSFASGSVEGNGGVGGLVAYFDYFSTLENSFAVGHVAGVSYGIGGLLGYSNSTTINSHWATDTTGQLNSERESELDNYFGSTLAELQCPTSSDNKDDCVISNTLYAGWDSSIWNFGTSTQLPGLIINGIIYRDGDGDGLLDEDDAFPYNHAASSDDDSDGYADVWTIGCDDNCISSSGLTLDQFPSDSAAWQDEDLDGYPDSWTDGCDANCQATSGLTLDSYPNDTDNDGINNSDDTDDNDDGITDADADSNGLIDISSLEQLNAIRYNLAGTGRTSIEGAETDSSGCPAVILDGVLQLHCSGYELTNILDFDTNADGVMDENDVYWNDGEGWVPVGDYDLPYTAVFDGNGYQIRNLYINRPSTNGVGLFGYVSEKTAELRNIGLTGELMRAIGGNNTAGLVGVAYRGATISRSYTTGDVAGGENVGGLAGNLSQNNTTINSFASGTVSGSSYVGGLAGRISSSTNLTNSFATGRVNAASRSSGGLVGEIANKSAISNSFATGSVTSSESLVGGLVGYMYGDSTITDSHWSTDTTGQPNSALESEFDNYFGATLAELQCPTSSDNTDDCVISNTLYAGWDSSIWDFGTSTQLPGLIINGILYRDSDGDSLLDEDDAFPNKYAASSDADGDGYADTWTIGCDANCINNSGLTLDQFLGNSAAWQDEDLDGYPDSWAEGCDSSCQNSSGLALDDFLNDTDNDGISNSDDTDDNNDGIMDADADSDGLIEVSTLEQLNAIRYNLAGTGRTSSEGEEIDSSGCPAVILAGVLQLQCSGYELTNNLDFDTNADGRMSANDTYWNGEEGWLPIGTSSLFPFKAIFDGNGYQVRNLYINRSRTDYVGLFGYISGKSAELRNIELTGELTRVVGDDYVGGLVGHANNVETISQSYVTGAVTGDRYVGGSVGRLSANSAITNSFFTGVVSGSDYVGGLVGYLSERSSISSSFAISEVIGDEDVGGLVGGGEGQVSISDSFATGAVSALYSVGALLGSIEGESVITRSFASGFVTATDSYGGGLVGNGDTDTVITNSHWATDTTRQPNSALESEFDNYFGATLAELQCPTSSDNKDDCAISNTLYAGWDSSVWDFGTFEQLPGLRIDGVVYRDIDGNGSLDSNLPPSVHLVLLQNGEQVSDITLGAGDVTLEAIVADADVNDTHTLTWALGSITVMSESATSVSFSSDELVLGNYTVSVKVADSGDPSLSDKAEITFTVYSAYVPEPAPENTSSGKKGGGGALGLIWLMLCGGLVYTRQRRVVFAG